MTKRFGALTAVDRIGLQVESGEIHGFLGPNGSGKTTFIRMLCGLLRPDGGSGTCLGFDVVNDSESIKRQVGYMTQRFSYWEDLTVGENLEFIARVYAVPDRRHAVRATIERMGLEKRRDQLAGTLSGGWKQRLALAACMLHSPKLLLLDEPTAGVDPQARREFWEQIHQLASEGITVLIATHYMDEAERCHRLAFVFHGRLLTHGTVDQVVRDSGLLTWAVAGPDLPELMAKLRSEPGVEQAVAFGNELHVAGGDGGALERVVAKYGGEGSVHRFRRIDPSLEDVFIHLMQQAKAEAGAKPPVQAG
ncbi:MAG TPA: ABC transporter ATP-binding protein [Planctomycetota bacterium]